MSKDVKAEAMMVSRDYMGKAVANMRQAIEGVRMFAAEVQQEIEEPKSKAYLAWCFEVVLDMAEQYHNGSVESFQRMFGKENEDGFVGADRKDEGGPVGAAGASVSEAGSERGEDQGAEGLESGGLGRADGEGAEHGGGDRDGSHEDTRE